MKYMRRNSVKIKVNREMKVTCFGGYFLINKMLDCLGLDELFGSGLGLKERERRFTEGDYLQSILANLMTNGIYVSDIDRLKADKTFQEYAGFERGIPSGNAVVKYMSKADEASIRKMKYVNYKVLKNIILEMREHKKHFGKTIFVFVDSTEIEVTGEMIEGAKINYNGDRALRMHSLYCEDFIVRGDLYSPSHAVTYGWRELLEQLSDYYDSG